MDWQCDLVALYSFCLYSSAFGLVGYYTSPQRHFPQTSQGFLHLVDHVSRIQSDRRAIDAQENFRLCSSRSLPGERPLFASEPQRWQAVRGRKVLVFSAFYERRPMAAGPSVRVVASGFQAQFNDIGDLYCMLWYEDRHEALSVGPAVYHRIYPSTAHADMWVSHFVICKLPFGMADTPYAVSVVREPCTPATNQLLVLNRKELVEKGQYSVCVSPMYNRFRDWELVVEMFELHRILGAEHITTYNFSMSSRTDQVLRSYLEDDGEYVSLIQWPFPPVKSNVFCQRGALNDCVYRNMNRYRYVAVVDFDEVLVPRSADTLQQMLSSIQKPGYGAYLFQHAYFRRNDSLSSEPYSVTQTAFYRTDRVTPAGKIRCKSLYVADEAVSVDLHYAYALTPDSEEYMLHPEEGMLHHYRPYPMESFKKHPERYNFIEDRFMEKYKQPLLKAIAKRKRKL